MINIATIGLAVLIVVLASVVLAMAILNFREARRATIIAAGLALSLASGAAHAMGGEGRHDGGTGGTGGADHGTNDDVSDPGNVNGTPGF